jgi:Beta-lactamase superfamily domain
MFLILIIDTYNQLMPIQVYIKWFPPSWIQIKTENHIIYIDPAYLKTNFAHYPKKIEYSKWPDPIDGLPEELGNDIMVVKPGMEIKGKNIYHAGDTDLIPEMRYIKNVDVALLPIGGRGFTMGLFEAVQAAKRIKPKVIIPMHRFETDPEAFKKLVEKEAFIKVKVLDIGETYQL